jgi:hypothetical protein
MTKSKIDANRRKPKPGAQAKAVVVPREPTDKERATTEVLKAHFDKFPARAEYRVENDNGNVKVSPRGDEKLFSVESFVAVGSTSHDFLEWQLNNAVNAIAGGKALVVTEQHYNSALAIMAAVQPENELEALLAAQMIAANQGALQAHGRYCRAEYVEPAKMYGNLANKFMRTFTAQMEQLRKMRCGGEQVVKHIHVHEGGQAVVAGRDINTIKGGGGSQDYAGQCQAAETASECAALPSPDASGNGVPIALHAERALQDARGHESGRSEGQP